MEEQCMGSPLSNISQLRMFVAAVALVCLGCAVQNTGPDLLFATLATHTKKDLPAKVPPAFNRLQNAFTVDAFVQKKTATSQKFVAPKISKEMLPHSLSTLDWGPLFIFVPMVMMIVWAALRVQSSFRRQQQYLTPLEEMTLPDIPVSHLAMAAATGRRRPFAQNFSPDGVQGEPESMGDALKAVEAEIKALAETIKDVERMINAVQGDISAVDRKITSLKGAMISMARDQKVDMEEEPILYLCLDDEGNLNLNKLMKKEQTLSEEKKMLMDKEQKLMDKEQMLMKEKMTWVAKLLKVDSTQSVDGLRAFSDDRCRLIEALRKGEYDKHTLESDCLMFTLRDKSISWLYQNEGEPLFVRRATQEVYKKIVDLENNVLLTGNPGIGKTWFHNYFLLEWIPTMKDDDILVLGKRDQKANIVVVKKGAPAFLMKEEEAGFLLGQRNVTYLVDTGGKEANEAEWCRGRTILTSSPAQRHYKSFLSSRDPIIMYYPPWELNELLAVKPKMKDNLSDEEVEERFNYVGGIPRHVFANEAKYAFYCQSMYSAIRQFDWSYPLILGQGNDLEFPHRLFIHHPRDNYTSFETGIASKPLCQEVYDFLKKKDIDMLRRFMDITRREEMFGVMWGQLYETSFFSSLMEWPKNKPFKMKLKRLLSKEEQKKAPKTPEFRNLKVNISNVVIARNVKSVLIERAASPEVIAVCPKATNFPAVDGLILDRSCMYGIQVTKDKSHDLSAGGLNTLDELKQILLEQFGKATVILIMVHLEGVEFNLTHDAWQNLKKYPEIKVYEAVWKSPLVDAARTTRGFLQR